MLNKFAQDKRSSSPGQQIFIYLGDLMFLKIIYALVITAAMFGIAIGQLPSASPLITDPIIVESGRNVFNVSGTNFTDYNFFGASDSGTTGIDVGSAGVPASIRNFLNGALASERASMNPGIGKKPALIGSMVGYQYTPPNSTA